jgi:hypothetical protein
VDPELRRAIASPERADVLAKLNVQLRFQETENLDEVLDAIADEVGLKARSRSVQSGE